jgi:hypothetical protein
VGMRVWVFRGVRDGGEGRYVLYGRRENEGKRGKNDLKTGLDGPKTEYVRTYIGTFDRTRAGEWVCEAACVRTYASTFERTRAVQWVRAGATVELHQGKVERSAVHVRTCSANFFFFYFFFNYIQKK